ncbi:MAG: hypothetical protein H6655_10885 [Ardenticatenaceae bacterium]|nr:hypothetical protein [Ardenticatenaceae bacterium]
MKRTKATGIIWLLILVGLLGCNEASVAVTMSPAVSPTLLPSSEPAATSQPFPTTTTAALSPIASVSMTTPTPALKPTATLAARLLPETYVDRVLNPPAGIWPNNVWWLPGVHEERPFLVQTGNALTWERLPIAPQTMFAYDAERGLLYFGEQAAASESGYATTDLRVYDFHSKTTSLLLPEGVAAMAWCSLRPVIAVVEDGRLNLIMPVANAEMDVVARDVSPTFSCIPGFLPPPADGGPGKLVAYVRGADLLLVNWFDGPTDLLVEGALSPEIAVPPVWDLTNEVLLVADEHLLLVPLNGSRYFEVERPFGHEPFTLTYANGAAFAQEGITKLFWSPQHRLLLLQTAQPNQEVAVYALSEQLGYVLDDPSLPRWRDFQIVGWLVDGEQIILLDDAGEPLVWDLATRGEVRP